jgi:tetratricopeptide (TPR) repeat protein
MKHSYPLSSIVLLLVIQFGTVQADSLYQAKQAFWQGNYQQAVLEWQTLLNTTSTPNHRLEALLGMARIHRRLGIYQKAQNLLQTALSVAERSGNAGYQALVFNEVSKLSLSEGKESYPAAIETGKQAVSLARQTNNPLVLIEVLNHWGNLLTVQNDYDGALDTFSDALTHVEQYQQQLPNQSKQDQKEIDTLRGKILINQAKTVFFKEAEWAQFQPTDFKNSQTTLQSALQSTELKWTNTYQKCLD